jgi:HlyD family secretion protein
VSAAGRSAVLRWVVLGWVALGAAGCTERGEPSYQGYIEGEFVSVAPAVPGRLDRLLVACGDQATNGAALFVLESENEAAARRQARHQLVADEARLADLRLGKRPPEVDVIRERLAQASVEAKRAAADRERDEIQYRSGGISAAELEASRARAESLAAQVREFERQIDVAVLPARDDQIRAQEAAVAAARAALDQAEWRLGQKNVAAPRSGLVYDTPYRVGEWVAAGRPVVRLLPPENVKVRFFVPEGVVGGVLVGRPVRIRIDGCPSDVQMAVTYVSSEAEYTPPVIYSNETRSKLIYLIEARPSAADAVRLHPGQPVEVFLP